LPRIKKASDEISTVPDQIAAGNWDAVNIFVTKTADDAVLPMKLYTSSLGGQGLNLKVAYLNDMSKAAETFDKNNLKLAKAAKKKDTEAAAAALGEMSVALTTYRTQGKLLGPDGGGDIPSVEVRAGLRSGGGVKDGRKNFVVSMMEAYHIIMLFMICDPSTRRLGVVIKRQ